MTRPVVAWPSPDGLAPQVVAAPEAPPPARLGRPILMVVGAVGLFAAADVFAKQLSADYPALQVAWVRYALLAAVAALLAQRIGSRSLRPSKPRLQLLRGLTLLGSGVLFILGLGGLGVAEATAVSFVTPALVTALSIPLLGEVVHLRRWTALLIGLAGVMVVLRPGGEAFQPAAVFPLGSAACGALMVILTRRIGSDDPTETTLLWSAGIGFLALSTTAVVWFEPMDVRALAIAAAMGGLYAVGQYLLVQAYRQGEASMLAPFSYAQILFATALGVTVFGAVPDAVSLAGMGLIVLGGVYTLYREGVLARLRLRAARARRGLRPAVR
ncbi:MAG TPA: DMT family transporter [Brevundimonas sp.]|nr:DMT family transporter [Brevundimonas sp.]